MCPFLSICIVSAKKAIATGINFPMMCYISLIDFKISFFLIFQKFDYDVSGVDIGRGAVSLVSGTLGFVNL
jgi:hypothetical protein